MGDAFKTMIFNVDVKFERREDGGLRAWSDSVPGFVLSNQDADLVISEVPEVLAVILSGMMGGKVQVTPTVDIREAMGLADVPLPAFVMDRVYVGRRRAA